MRLKDRFFYFMGNWRIFKYPFWFVYAPKSHDLVKRFGVDTRSFEDLLKPGDVIFRRYEDYTSTFFIASLSKEFWTHVGIIDDDLNVIHALKDGVVRETLGTFCNTDYIAVRRFETFDPDNMVEKAKNQGG